MSLGVQLHTEFFLRNSLDIGCIWPVTLKPHFGWKSWLRSLRMLEKGVVFFWEMLECIYLTYLILFSFFVLIFCDLGMIWGCLKKGGVIPVITLINGLIIGFYWGEVSLYLQSPPFITGVFFQAHLVLNQQIKLNRLYFWWKNNDESHEIRIRNQTSPTKQIQIIHLPQKIPWNRNPPRNKRIISYPPFFKQALT